MTYLGSTFDQKCLQALRVDSEDIGIVPDWIIPTIVLVREREINHVMIINVQAKVELM